MTTENTDDEAMARWLTDTLTEPGSDMARDALRAVGPRSPLTARYRDDALGIGALLWERQVPAIKRKLTEVDALRLAMTLVDAALGPYPTESHEDAADRFRRWVTNGFFDTEQEAAFCAVRQLGGHEALGLRPWEELCLGDHEHSTADEHVIRRAKLAAANVAPGIEWWLVEDLGFVVIRRGERPKPPRAVPF